MAPKSTFTPKASLTDAPTNLKEAIDWVLRVTGRDGKENKDECICGLAAAVTDLLQSVVLQYNGYQGDKVEENEKKRVEGQLHNLFSLVQGLGGTAVVRTYIDQLAQVLSALVGWSKIEKCDGLAQKNHGTKQCNGGKCKYLEDVKDDRLCKECRCIKGGSSSHLGRGCQRCKDGGGSTHRCSCSTPGGGCQGPDQECKCAAAGKCCKCCCSGSDCKEKCKKNAKCSCIEENTNGSYCRIYNESYQSAYSSHPYGKHFEQYGMTATWNAVHLYTGVKTNGTPTNRRHHCARILLGSVCLIWSGITYMYWTGKQPNAKNSPYWNNHILDGSGLDDGTLSQWLQALGFPRDMLNNKGPENRMDKVIDEVFVQKFYLGFPDTSNYNGHGMDRDGNSFRSPANLHFGGFIHEINKGAFGGNVFKGNGTDTGIDPNKLGPIYKLYILSCAYFTGLQKKTPPKADNKTPRTIREVLYWLSALPYSTAYKDMLTHAKKELDKVAPEDKKLSFKQQGRDYPITVEEVNLYAHFQAVTQYCPLVLIGIQGGIHSATKGTDRTTEPAIHALYSNSHFSFTYPTVSIQAYNQVVHYIRALFYQLYFLRKQCAVKVTCGGKWRECRYGKDVVSKGVISWMCLGCNPMEHDRHYRVGKVKGELDGVKSEAGGTLSRSIKELLVPLGHVVIQLGNAQEALERGKEKDHIYQSLVIGLVGALGGVLGAVKGVVEKGSSSLGQLKGVLEKVIDVVLVVVNKLVEGVKEKENALKNGKKEAQKELGSAKDNLEGAKEKLKSLSNKDNGSLKDIWEKLGAHGDREKSLPKFIDVSNNQRQVDPSKSTISEFIHKVRVALEELWMWARTNGKELMKDIENMFDIVGSTRCVHCRDHANKCGKEPVSKYCITCHQQYMDGFPSPLQAFLEDRLPGFSCDTTMVALDKDPNDYPLAASHLYHNNSPGQCCPLPMGFRGHFHGGSISGMTGQRLFGILYFFSNENMMQSCVYRLVRVTSALSATTPQVLGDVFGFFRGGVGNKERGETKKNPNGDDVQCNHQGDPSQKKDEEYFCGWCASGLRDEVRKIEWIPKTGEAPYQDKVGTALIKIKGEKGTSTVSYSSTGTTPSNLSTLTDGNHYVSPLTGELYTAVSATFGHVYLQWVLYLSDALQGGLQSLASAFQQIECRGCRECDPNRCKKGHHGDQGDGQCRCQSIVSCTGVLPVLYRHGFSYGNPFNLEGYQQKNEKIGDYSITENKDGKKHCHEFLESLKKVIERAEKKSTQEHPLTNLLSQVGKLQYDIRLPWIFVLTLAWLVAVLYLAFGAIWPLDWTHMRSHCRGWFRKGSLSPWEILMVGKKKGRGILEFFGKT